MMNAGKIQRKFCVDCGSRNVKDLNFISHSLAHCQLEFIFTQLVPLKSQPERFPRVRYWFSPRSSHICGILMFVISHICYRLTAFLPSGVGSVVLLFSAKTNIATGIEQNEEFVKLQQEVIRNFNLQNIEVVCADVRAQPDLVSNADLIIMNNVFSFFMEADEQLINATNPKIETVLAHLKLSFTVEQWLEKIPIDDDCEMFASGDADILADCATLGLYRVL
ncbi:hypothetical protein COOONC_08414 [Cooperia oncophora]